MSNNTLESRLRDTYQAVAATTDVEDRWSELAGMAAPASRERHPLLVAAAAFAVVLVTVGSLALISALVDRDRGLVSPPVDSEAAADQLRYPVPNYIPPGVNDVWAQIPVRDPDWPSVVTAVVGRRTLLDGEGPVPDLEEMDIEDIVAVHVRRAVPEDATEEGEVIMHAGRELLLLPEGSFAGSASLMWTEGDVTAVVFVSDGDVDRGLDVVAGVRWTGDDPTAPGAVVVDPPEGFELINEPTIVSENPGPMITMQWDDAVPPATVPGAEPPVVGVLQVDVSVSADSPELVLASYPTAQSFELRGRHAYIVWHRQFNAVIWEETPGTTVTVSGWLADPTELIRIAEAVEFTDEASWRSLYDVFDPAGVAPTTAPPTTRAG